jgi:hypothetical protein
MAGTETSNDQDYKTTVRREWTGPTKPSVVATGGDHG